MEETIRKEIDVKMGRKFNVAIAFENDKEAIFKEGVFFVKDVEVDSVSAYDKHVFNFCINKRLLNFSKDNNYKEYSGCIPISDNYVICFRDNKLNMLDYASSYRCYFFVTNEQDSNIAINKMFDLILEEKYKTLDALQKQVKECKFQIETIKQANIG